MVVHQIGDMKYVVYDDKGKVVVITSVRTIAEKMARGET